MKLFHVENREGRVTRAQYQGPCGGPMAASFYGWKSEKEVKETLERWRAIDMKIPKTS